MATEGGRIHWPDMTAQEPRFAGKRLSEVAKMALHNLSPLGPNLTAAEKSSALMALAIAWLDLCEEGANHYRQQQIDKGETL